MKPKWRLVDSAIPRKPWPSLGIPQPSRLGIERSQHFSSSVPQMVYRAKKFKTAASHNQTFAKYARGVIDNGTVFHLRPATSRHVQLLGFVDASSTIAASRSLMLGLMIAGYDSRSGAEFMIGDEGSKVKKVVADRFPPRDMDLLVGDVPVLSEVLYILAKSGLTYENKRAWERLAIFTYGVSVELGNELAAIDLWRLESLRSENKITGTVHTVVKRLAQSKRDWRAMSVYLDYLLKNQSTPAMRREAYDLAKDLYEMTQPGANDPGYIRPQDRFEPPWKLLRDAADQHLYDIRDGPEADEVQETYDRAIREGVTKYRDPDACIQLAGNLSVKDDSKAWLDLKTKSAMAGDAESCFDIARYWLEQDGWYPVKNMKKALPKALNAENQAGFDWMELAASGSETAKTMASRYLAMALILRENGLAETGRGWLDVGMDRMEEQERLSETDSRMDPKIKAETGIWISKLADFASNWNESFGANAAQLLGDPILK